jgi:hypothetical protein
VHSAPREREAVLERSSSRGLSLSKCVNAFRVHGKMIPLTLTREKEFAQTSMTVLFFDRST